MKITRQISSYNFSSRNNNSIKYIVLHDTGNYKDTASANSNYFNVGNRQASAHYFVDESSIYQVVEDYNSSWHCGDGYGKYGITNGNSIGIEMCNSGGYIAELTIQNTIELVKSLMYKYSISIDNVVRHYDASRKTCPNNMSANGWKLWYKFKSRLVNVQSAVPQMDSENEEEEGNDYMSKLYQNGSTRENVYADFGLSNKIGSLDPWESCQAIADLNNRIIVLYNTSNGKKTGFVAYRGGL